MDTNQTNNQETHEILEIVRFIKDNAVTQTELKSEFTQQRGSLLAAMDTKLGLLEDHIDIKLEQRLEQHRSDIITHVDSFAALHQKLEQELTALRAKYERIEERLERVEKHLALQPA